MSGYPNLYPSGFVEFNDSCTGPLRYRNQPSRESSGPTLNDFMNKYVTGDIKYNDYIQMLTYLKFFSRNWNKLREKEKREIRNLLASSNSEMARQIFPGSQRNVEMFTDDGAQENDEETLMNKLNAYIDKCKQNNDQLKDIKVVSTNPQSNILVLVVVANVCILLGYMIACCQT